MDSRLPKSTQHCWLAWSRIVILAGALAMPCGVFADEIRPDYIMFHDPEFAPAPEIQRLDENLLPLWRQALARPEADYQRMAAEAIGHAASEGFPGLEPARAELLVILTARETHPAARFAAARALIVLDTRSAAQPLFEMSQRNGSQLRQVVEPALAEWEFAPIWPVWRERVGDPRTNRRELLLALDGLARARDADVLPAMLDIVHSSERSPDVRVSAARAAGAVADTGLEEHATRLLGSENASVVQHLCAVALLARHRSERAREQLAMLGGDVEPTVVEQALGTLNAIDPALVVPLAGAAMQNPDPKVRRRGADAYVALPTPERIASLSELLDDPHPDVRRSVRDDLRRLAERPELSDVVCESAMDILGRDGWRGQEQAALLLGALDYEPAASRLVELLRAQRSEVMVATAWALRMLAIPDTCPALLAHARFQTVERNAERSVAGLDAQVAHLFEALTLMNDPNVEGLLREYVPKKFTNGYYSRGAAVWALGHYHAGTPDEGLALQLVKRMNDLNPFSPEMDIVRKMSAITLGRMHAESQLPALRQRLAGTGTYDPVAYAIRWSIHLITGEDLPDPGPIVRSQSGWFLEPLPKAAVP